MKSLLLILAIFFLGCSSNNLTPTTASTTTYATQQNQAILKLDTKGHTRLIGNIIVTKSGNIISINTDKTIRVWNSKTGIENRKILGQIGRGTKGEVFTIALSPNEEFLAVGGDFKNNNIRIYNYKSGKLLKVLKSHTNTVTDLSFSNDGKYLISGSGDFTAKIWNVKNYFNLQDTIKSHSAYINRVKIIKKNQEYLAITIGLDNKISLYNINRKKTIKERKFNYKLKYLATTSTEIALYHSGKEIIIMDYNLNIKKNIHTKSNPIGLLYSPNKKYLIIGTEKNIYSNIDIYNTKEYSLFKSFKIDKKLTRIIKFLDEQTILLEGEDKKELYIYDIKNEKIIKKIKEIENIIWSVGIKGNKIAWGNINCGSTNCQELEKVINLKKIQINSIKDSLFNKISTINGDYSLIQLKKDNIMNNFGSVLSIVKDSRLIAKIVKNSTNGYHHSCYGWYKDYILSGGTNGMLIAYNKQGKEIASLVGHTEQIWSIAVDGDRLISGSNDQTISIWDLSKLDKMNKEKKVYNKNTIKFYMKQYNLTREEVIKIAKENNINLYKIPTIQPELSLFITKTNDWIAWTPEGYFNASEKGVNYLYFHLNQGSEKEAKAIPMKKLYDHFFRPDLIRLKLAGEEKAYRKAIGNLDFREALKNPAPLVKLDRVTTETSKDKIKLSFTIEDEGGGVGNIRIYQEGKLIQTIGNGEIKRQSANIDSILEQEQKDSEYKNKQKKYIAKLSKSTSSVDIKNLIEKVKPSNIRNHAGDYTIEVDLKSGQNEIAIEAFNKTNTVASYRESINVTANIPKRKAKLYAIVAGINNFESDNVNALKYSENDAKAIKEVVEQEMKTVFADIEVHPLIGKNVTKTNILAKAKEISLKAKLEDTVLFYISTHGRTVNGKLYLVPYNNKNGENWIDFEQTFNAVQSIKALNQIFIIDACESGKANDMVSAVYDSKASVLAKSSGVHMLLATTKGTSAFESNDPHIKNGVFTYRVLTALRNRTTDINHDNFITVKELSTELKKPQSNADFQYPIIRNVGNDIRLKKVQ